MAKRVSVINFKGGVGKTTFSFHLATGLEKYHNARVLGLMSIIRAAYHFYFLMQQDGRENFRQGGQWTTSSSI